MDRTSPPGSYCSARVPDTRTTRSRPSPAPRSDSSCALGLVAATPSDGWHMPSNPLPCCPRRAVTSLVWNGPGRQPWAVRFCWGSLLCALRRKWWMVDVDQERPAVPALVMAELRLPCPPFRTCLLATGCIARLHRMSLMPSHVQATSKGLESVWVANSPALRGWWPLLDQLGPSSGVGKG